MFRLLSALLYIMIASSLAWASPFDGTINKMVRNGTSIATVHSKDTGYGVIAIGYGSGSQNKAREIARLDALKTLAAYLKGERISGVESLEMSFSGDDVSESFYTRITSNVDATLKSVELLLSGMQGNETWVAMAVTEQGHQVHGMLAQVEASNEVKARGTASMRNGAQKARQLALQDALRNAVEQYNGVKTASRSSVENQETLRSGIATVSSGTVEKYVVAKEFVENNMYYIDIVAKISTEETAVSNEAVRESFGRPAFYIDTKDAVVKDMFIKLLSTHDFLTTNDKQTARYIVGVDSQKETYDIPAKAGSKGMRTTLLVDVRDKQNIQEALFSISNNPNNSVEISSNMTLLDRNSSRYAMEDIEEDFIDSLNKMFNQQFNNGTKIRVTLVGFNGMREVDQFRQCLLGLPQTKSANSLSSNNRSVEFEVIYLGPTQSLQLEILKKSREYSLHGLRAKDTKDGSLVFQF